MAESAIGNLRSGAAVTATLSAPAIGTVTEFDANVVTDFPMPTVPASVKGEILAEAAAIRTELDTEKQALADVFAQFAADVETNRLEIADTIQRRRHEIQSLVDRAHRTLQDQLDTDRNVAQKIIDRTKLAASRVIANIKAQAKAVRKLLETNLAIVWERREAAYQRAIALANASNQMFQRLDARIEKHYQQLLQESKTERLNFLFRNHKEYNESRLLYMRALKSNVDMLVFVDATLAKGAYKKNFSPIIGDHVVVEVFVDKDSGGRAVLFYNTKTGEYVLGFPGIQDVKDLTESGRQAFGFVSAQYEWAMDLVDDLVRQYGAKLSFTGHSLGGALATVAALRHGLRATVFDPAGLSEFTIKRYNLQIERAKELVTVYRLQGDPLTAIQDANPMIYGIDLMPDTVVDHHHHVTRCISVRLPKMENKDMQTMIAHVITLSIIPSLLTMLVSLQTSTDNTPLNNDKYQRRKSRHKYTEDRTKLIKRILNADNFQLKGRLLIKLFDISSEEQIKELQNHTDLAIAVFASWNLNDRHVQGKRFFGYHPRSEKYVQRFLGFLEGRLGFTPPKWWEDKLTSGGVPLKGHHEQKMKTKISIPSKEEIKKTRIKFTTVKQNGIRIQIPVTLFEKYSRKRTDDYSFEFLENPYVKYRLGKTRSYFYYVQGELDEGNIICMETKSGKVLWSSENYGLGSAVTRPMPNIPGAQDIKNDLIIHGNKVIIFGNDYVLGQYMEIFDAETGKNLVRFSSSYWYYVLITSWYYLERATFFDSVRDLNWEEEQKWKKKK